VVVKREKKGERGKRSKAKAKMVSSTFSSTSDEPMKNGKKGGGEDQAAQCIGEKKEKEKRGGKPN